MFSHEDTNPGATDRAPTEAVAALVHALANGPAVISPFSAEETAGRAPTEAVAGLVGALANSNRRLRLAFEQSTTGSILVDFENKVLEVNDTFC